MPNDLPAVRPPSLPARVLSSLVGWFVRGAPTASPDEPIKLGADYGAGEATPTYDPKAAMSSFAAFPWKRSSSASTPITTTRIQS